MDILGDRKFVEVPGSRTHELPPILLRPSLRSQLSDQILQLAGTVLEGDDLLSALPAGDERDFERRRTDLALNLAEQYLALLERWRWGDAVVEWIRQCEITFDARAELRPLLRPDIWPHAGRTSFVALLADKKVAGDGSSLEKAVGLRLTFRQPPPIGCFSNQFLFYLNSPVAETAYRRWASLSPAPVSCLPPERFSVQVVDMSL